MIVKFVALSALTAAGVGTVIALNPSEIRPGSTHRTTVNVPSAITPAPTLPADSGLAPQAPEGPRRGPHPHFGDRPQYVPPNAGLPPGPGLADDGRELTNEWSEHEGWHGEWDDDARTPAPNGQPTRSDRDDEQEDGR